MNIPDDVMAKAMTLAAMAQGTVAAGVEWGVEPITERKDIASDIARALLSERESATKAERERCAERFEIAATELGRQECCGFATSDHECCADPLYMISDRDGARAIRNGADFVPAAAIRKGDGE